MRKYKLPKQIDELAASLGMLPGIGPKMASRLSIYLATRSGNEVDRVVRALTDLQNEIGICPKTGNITTNGQIDSLFTDPERDRTKLLIVETPLDLIQIESSNSYSGLYLVLGGLIAPLNGVGPDQLNLHLIHPLLDSESIDEIILALSSTVEGEATSLYIKRIVEEANPDIHFTRLARGLPSGATIEFLDSSTISSALQNRDVVL